MLNFNFVKVQNVYHLNPIKLWVVCLQHQKITKCNQTKTMSTQIMQQFPSPMLPIFSLTRVTINVKVLIISLFFKGEICAGTHLIDAHFNILILMTHHLHCNSMTTEESPSKTAQMKATHHSIASLFPLSVPRCFFVKVSVPRCIISQIYFLPQPPHPSYFELFLLLCC